MSDEDVVMSEPSSSNNNEVNLHVNAAKISRDLLSEHLGCKIDEKFVLKLVKETKNVSKEVKEACKVLEFSFEWKIDEILTAIDELNLQEFLNLFVIIIRCQNLQLNNADQLKKKPPKKKRRQTNSNVEVLLSRVSAKFRNSQHLILQITSIDENATKFYYKGEPTRSDLIEVQQNLEAQNPFSTFLCDFLNDKFESIEQLAAAWKQNSNSKLASKFLKLFGDLFFKLILKVTKNGTKADLQEILEAPVENEGRILNTEAQSYLSKVLYEKQLDNQPASDSDDSTAEPEDDSADESEDESEDQNSSSVLLTATEHKKTEIIDFLISYCTHLIQQLPILHQLQISTTAFNSNQLDVLCDLIDKADFPFPEDFDVDDEFEHERLQKIAISRLAFSEAIKKENFTKIDKFIDNHLSLKVVYSTSNDTALEQAIEVKKFGVFYYLKSLGFQGGDIPNDLSKDERKKAAEQAVQTRKANIKLGLVDDHKSVMLLATRSLIHNRKISKEQEKKYRDKIKNWLKDIHKVAPEMLDVAASCEYLKIIFDFESETVENASLAGPDSLGSAYPVSKWIFIGAKLSDQSREQKIKGVLAHELCHYVMRLVYENQENPYFKDRLDVKEMFEKITNAINKWIPKGPNEPDDECNGIISTAFTLYKPNEFHLELIVRVVHILTQFDDDENKTKLLQEKYQNLFNFWHQQVVPDLQTYLQKNHEIVQLNQSMELLQKIQKLKKLGFSKAKEFSELTSNKLVIVTTNVAKLFFLEIMKNLESKDGKLMDSQFLFINSSKLKSHRILSKYNYMCEQIQTLTVFVDFSKGFSEELVNKIFRPFINCVFVVSNEDQSKNLMEILLKKEKDIKELEVNYEWNDLTEESQNKLLESKKINFQNDSKMSMKELFKVKNEVQSDELQNLFDVINAELLNMLINEEEILINSQNKVILDEKQFELLNIEREFLIKTNDNKSKPVRISQDNLLKEIKNKKFVLISDMAGNGKSWAMKNFSKILSNQNPPNWATYVDLKQFIKEFKEQAAQQVMPEFSTFMAEKILKRKQKFEAKIFKKLYKDGKVFIFLDGFDEIAPDCAEFVSNLAQSFEQNGGNQLWIATRDYFEIDLMEKLEVDVAYGLKEMDDWQGIEMITKSWILMDLDEKIKSMTLEKFNQYIKDSSDYKKYIQKATKIVQKVKTYTWGSVGMPQMFKMIADGFKIEQNLNDLTRSKMYGKYVKSLLKRWRQEKGEIREEASIESQRQQFNFWKFHRFHAIASRLPKLAKILFPGYDGKDLRAEDVVGCGIVSIKNGKVYFNHETLREYFIADVLVEELKKEEMNENVVEVLVEVLTLKENKVIRMFLSDSIEPTNLVKFLQKVKNFVKKFTEFEILQLSFKENLENFVDVFFLILKDIEYEKIKENLEQNSSKIARDAGSSEIFLKFQDFIFEFLNSEDLKNLIKNQKILENIIENKNLGFDVFTDFVLKIESKIGFDFAQEELKRTIYDKWINNNDEDFKFNFIFNVKDQKALKLQKFMKMLQKFLSPEEVLKFLKKTNKYGQNILFECVWREKKEFLEILWTEIEKYFASQNKSQEFKKFFKQKDYFKKNILHKVADFKNIEIHKVLWKLFLNTFEDREELKDFVLQKDGIGNNFIHDLVSYRFMEPEIIEWNLKNLKQNFNNSQFQEILQSRGKDNRSLLHSTADGGHKIEVFKLLWQEFCSSCKSDQEFWKVLEEIDRDGKNILKYAACESPVEVFDFLIDEIEKNYSKEEIKKLLSNSDNSYQSLLHHAAENKSADVFKAVWIKFQEYLTKEEILEIAKQVSNYEENFLFRVKSGENFEFAIVELEKIATKDEIKIMLNIISYWNRNILQNAALTKKSLNFHESLWKILKKYFEKSEILNLIKNVDEDGNNVLHIAVSNYRNSIEVVEFTWNEIKICLNHEQQIEYLKMKGKYGKNLIELCRDDKNKYWMENLFDEYKIKF